MNATRAREGRKEKKGRDEEKAEGGKEWAGGRGWSLEEGVRKGEIVSRRFLSFVCLFVCFV